MPPPLSIKHLYAAFAENSSCGARYYDEPLRCGSAATAADDGLPLRRAPGDIAQKRTFDGSLEVGIRPDSEVFEHSFATPPRRKQGGGGTPDTSPNTPSPESSLQNFHGNRSGYPYHEVGYENGGQQHHRGQPCSLPNPPNLHAFEGIATHQRYAGPVMKKNIFVRTASTASNASRGSTMSRCITPDSIERARGVTFRESKRVPKSVNAPLSKSSSTLSRDEGYGQVVGPAYAPFVPNDYDNACVFAANEGSGAGAFASNEAGRTSAASEKEAKNEPNDSEASKDERVSPTLVKFDFEYGPHNIVRDAAPEHRRRGDPLATSNMFTKEDLDAITPLQIATYLTVAERKKIGTKVLSSKLSKGYNLAGGKDVCDSCNLPMLRRRGQLVEACAICPVLKKKVLKKILDCVAVPSDCDSSLTVTTLATMPSTDMSLGTGMSASKDDEHVSASKDDDHISASKGDEHDFVVAPSNDDDISKKSVTFWSGAAEKNGTGNKALAEDGFILKAKKSLADAFKTNCQQLGFGEGGQGAMEQARGLVKKVTFEECQRLDLEEGKEAVAHAGEMMVKKAALVPEALKYKESKAASCQGYQFGYGKEVMAHASEFLTNNVSCSPDGSKHEVSNEANDLLENERDDELAEDGIEAQVALAEQDGYEEEIIGKDTSADAEEDDVLLNGWMSSQDHKNDELAEIGIEADQVKLAEQNSHEEEMIVEDASADAEEDDVLLNGWMHNQDQEVDELAKNGFEADRVALDGQGSHEEETAVEGGSANTEEDDVPLSGWIYNQKTKSNDDVAEEEEEEDVKDEDDQSGPGVTHLHPEQIEIESPSSPTQDEPPLATISTSGGTGIPLLAEEQSPHPPNSDQRLDSAQSTESVQRSHASPGSIVSALGSTAKSTTSTDKSEVSSMLVSLMDRIKHTKKKMLTTDDLNEQIQCAELLAKLSAAAVELKKLEAVA